MKKFALYLGVCLTILSSCVTPKVYNALVAENESVKEILKIEEKKGLQLQSDVEELQGEVASLKAKIIHLINDSLQNGEMLIAFQNKYDVLSESYDLLASKNSRYMSEKANEIKLLLKQLEEAQLELFEKEDELSKLSTSLEVKEDELKLSQEKLDARSIRVAELETIINQKDSIVTLLKNSISKALVGLEGEGLTIEQRNGKVYISLEEDLLFASGKYEVNSKGVATLDKLATVLAQQDGLEILVEGHTDSIPFNGKGLVTDNWDLSVMRATNVVKVLTKNTNLHPLRLIAAGRGEFVPIASNKTKEGRSKNRRIEMILSPNLDDLFKLLEE